MTDDYIVANEVVAGGIYVFDRRNEDLFTVGDGFSGGHHLTYKDDNGDTIVLRPSFGFSSTDAHLKVDDNTITLYNLGKRTARTFYYSWEQPNHFPTDMYKEGKYLYMSYAVPGSVCKIDLDNGRVVARFAARPGIITRYLSMMLDGFYSFLDYGTMRNRYDASVSHINQVAHSFEMGRLSGTRGGFFAMGVDQSSSLLHVCHRGLNRSFCLEKETLRLRWSRPLPSRKLRSQMVGPVYKAFPYFRRCLGVHHGTLVHLED